MDNDNIVTYSQVENKGIVEVVIDTAIANSTGTLAGIVLTCGFLMIFIERTGFWDYFKELDEKLDEIMDYLKSVKSKLDYMEKNDSKLTDKLLNEVLYHKDQS